MKRIQEGVYDFPEKVWCTLQTINNIIIEGQRRAFNPMKSNFSIKIIIILP